MATAMKNPDMEVSGKKVLVCSACKDQKIAKCYCCQCGQYLCTDCEKAHEGTRATKNHDVLSKDDMLLTSLKDSFLCKKHNEDLYHFFCSKHNEPCCVGCILDHKKCKLERIEDIAGSYCESQEFRMLVAQIGSLESKVNKAEKLFISQYEATKKELKNEGKDVEDFSKTIRQKCENAERDLTDEIKKCKKGHKQYKEVKVASCKDLISELGDVQGTLKKLETRKLIHIMFLIAKKSIPKVKQIEMKIQQLQGENGKLKCSFKRNEDAEKLILNTNPIGEIVTEDRSLYGRINMKANTLLKNLFDSKGMTTKTNVRVDLIILAAVFIIISFGLFFCLSTFKTRERFPDVDCFVRIMLSFYDRHFTEREPYYLANGVNGSYSCDPLFFAKYGRKCCKWNELKT